MINPIEPMLTLYQAQLQASKDIAGLALSGAEQISHIALQATKDGVREQLEKAQALCTADDVQAAAALREAPTQPDFERATACARELLKTVSEIYAGMSSACGAYAKQFDRAVEDVVSRVEQKPSTAANAGAGNMFELWDSAWRQFNAITEQYVRASKTGGAEQAAAAAARPAPAASTRPSHTM